MGRPEAPKLRGTWRYFALIAAIAFSACDCEDDQLSTEQPGTCEQDYQCETGFEYRQGACRQSRCQIDADCCPGQKCNASAGFCADQLVACTSDEECVEKPGQLCIEQRGGRFCGFPNKTRVTNAAGRQACASNADCDPGRSCFDGRCVTVAPCEGGCTTGLFCDVDTLTCAESQLFESCRQACPEGQMLVLKDPDTMSGPLCCELDCECVTLPPVLGGQTGWYASLGLTEDRAYVSAYDEAYGDLVVAGFDNDGNQVSVEYVDGFPSTGALVGDPNGPRGGRNDPGPDVGTHTSLAVDTANVVHIAYRDEDMGVLKYANNAGGTWNISVIDQTADTGYYTSIKIGSDGNPRVAYMMGEGTIDADPVKKTALKYAAAKTPLPASPSDWDISVVDSAVKPEPICGGGCGMGRACVDLGGGPACQMTTVGCMMCGSNEACVDAGGGTPKCEARINAVPLDDFIAGTGLFASLALTSTNGVMIAYYDRLQGNLRFAYSENGGFVLRTLDGADPMDDTDVGQHASLALGPNGPAVAYFDASHDDLVYMDVRTRAREIVDDGVSAPNLRLVGADASLLFDESGHPAIAYQDPTLIDLLYARKIGNPPMWSTEVIYGAAPAGMDMGTASGFYVSQARRGTSAFISNVDVNFTAEGDLLLSLSVLKKQLD